MAKLRLAPLTTKRPAKYPAIGLIVQIRPGRGGAVSD